MYQIIYVCFYIYFLILIQLKWMDVFYVYCMYIFNFNTWFYLFLRCNIISLCFIVNNYKQQDFQWEQSLSSQWMPPVEWVGIETPYSIGSSWRPLSMHCLLSPAASNVSWYWPCFVCSGLAYEIYSGGGPFTYVYWVVCYHVIAAPYVRSVGHVFTYYYTLVDDSECQMNYETSWHPKVIPSLIRKLYLPLMCIKFLMA